LSATVASVADVTVEAENPATAAPSRPLLRAFLPLAVAILLLGVADAMVHSYLVLFAADEVGMSPLRVGVFATAPAVGGIVVSWLLGRRFDRRPARAYTVVVTALAAVALVLMTRTTSFAALVLIAAVLFGGVAAAFPQLFAMARVVLGDGALGQRAAPLLRSAWSLAWAVGPLIGAVLLSRSGFTTILAVGAALMALTALVTAVAVPRPRLPDARAPDDAAPPPAGRSVALLTASIALFFTAMFAGSVALPLFVTRGLDEDASSVGVLFSVCAFVEVLASLALAAVPAHVSQRALILGGMAAFVLYFVMTVVASGMGLLVAGQVARGVAIAVVGAAGIRFFQDLLAPAAGRATTLFANASTTGALVSGVLAGTAVTLAGYTATLTLCAGLAAAAAVTFALGSRDHHPPTAADPAADGDAVPGAACLGSGGG
jgi:SET family sugar efflux transporter-like MFS transporter